MRADSQRALGIPCADDHVTPHFYEVRDLLNLLAGLATSARVGQGQALGGALDVVHKGGHSAGQADGHVQVGVLKINR